jgi:type I restriction enzyme R subunit
LNAYIDPAVERFKGLSEEEQEDFKNAVKAFLRLYAFLSQVMPFHDLELEKLFTYLQYFHKKLPKGSLAERFQLQDEVALEYYRLQKMEEGNIGLQANEEGVVYGASESGMRKPKEEFAPISQIIEVLNDKLGTDFTPADQLFFDQIEEEMVTDKELVQQARNNTQENFRYGFNEKFMDVVIERMGQNQELFAKLMDDEKLSRIVKDMLMDKVYRRARED